MKKHIKLFNVVALAFLLTISSVMAASAQKDDGEKRRTISKSYTVGSEDKLSIDNSFGDVVINTWDKSEFKIDVEIFAKATSDDLAQKMLDHMKVEDSKTGNTVSFKTEIHINGGHHDGEDDKDQEDGDNDNDRNSGKHRNGNTDNKHFHVNYTVYMPQTNPLELINQFGKTTLPDFKGPVRLTSKFGSLRTGNLDNVQSVDVEFGNAIIGDIHNGKITLKYDDKSTVGKLSGSVKIDNEFTDLVQYNVGDDINDLNINEQFSDIRVVVSKDFSAHFTIHTNFGDFSNHTDFSFSDKPENSEDDNGSIRFDKDFSGISGAGKANVRIRTNFGNVSLAHNILTREELDKEKKERKEHKERKEKKEKKEQSEDEESK